MAVFSAIGAVIAGALGLGGTFVTIAGVGLSFTGTLVAGVIAGGLGMATSKVLGLNKAPNIQNPKDPGTKIQLAPSTDNRIPVFYGRINTGALIVDAQIKNQNNTMVYVMVIGEKTDSGTYTVNKIKRQDATLNFSGATVTSITDPNATASNRVNGKMRCRVFAGNAQSTASQIFPTTGTPVTAQSLCATITAATNYEDLVYAVFEIDYDPENQLTSLGTLTFDITNSLSEPSNVLLDYCRNDRYGAGLANADLVLSSFDDMYDYSTANVEYTSNANISAYHDRWAIDGMLSTYNDVKTNIDGICMNSATFFTYDNKQGKFKVVPNRAATVGEKSAAFVFDDDNIVGEIEITSTELYSMYNSVEAEFPDITKQDQTNTIVVETPSGDRNTNEPDNPLTTRYELTNNRSRVYNLANIDLRQSRLSTVCTFDATYEAIQVDVGDIVKLTSSLYGFSEKLFRCMRITEKERNDGMLVASVVLLEYNDSVYEHNVIQSATTPGIPGIPGWWTGIWGNANINIPGNIIITDPGNATANIVDPPTGNIIGNVDYGNIDWGNISFGGIGGVDATTPVATVPITTPDIPGVEEICIDLGYDNALSGIKGNTCYTIPAPGGGTFEPGTNTNVAVPLPDLPPQNPTIPGGPIVPDLNLNFGIWGTGNGGNWQTNTTYIPDVPVINPGYITPHKIQDIGVALQVDENPAANTAMVDAAADPTGTELVTGANSIFEPATVIPLGGIDYGEYTTLNSVVPIGALNVANGATVAFTVGNNVAYEEVHEANLEPTGLIVYDNQYGEGIVSGFDTAIPPVLSDNFSLEISPERGNAAATEANVVTTGKKYLPANITIQPYGNTSLDQTGTGQRGFKFKGDLIRNTKGDRYRDLR
jgi:hypothetical protein